MAKRLAEGQITKENHPEIHGGDNEVFEKHVAPPEVMAKRKILKPKGKSFEFAGNVKALPSTLNRPVLDLKAVKLRALAQQFENAISKTRSTYQIPDYRPIVQKYLKFYSDIESSSQESNKSNLAAPILSNAHIDKSKKSASGTLNPFAQIANISNLTTKPEPDEIGISEHEGSSKVQGPVFQVTTVPIKKTSSFTVNTNKSKDVSTSNPNIDNACQMKGPAFTFNKQIHDPVFKINSSLEASRSNVSSGSCEIKGAEVGEVLQEQKKDTSGNSFSKSEQEGINLFDKGETSTHSDVPASSDPDTSVAVLFQVKAKLLLLDTKNEVNPYKSLGVGNLQVLPSNNSISSRVLMRAEGGLQILLNALLIKDAEYTKLGNGCFIRFPAIDEKSNLVTYVFKVGSVESGETLMKILNEAKSL